MWAHSQSQRKQSQYSLSPVVAGFLRCKSIEIFLEMYFGKQQWKISHQGKKTTWNMLMISSVQTHSIDGTTHMLSSLNNHVTSRWSSIKKRKTSMKLHDQL